jgi:hypothetical protein
MKHPNYYFAVQMYHLTQLPKNIKIGIETIKRKKIKVRSYNLCQDLFVTIITDVAACF